MRLSLTSLQWAFFILANSVVAPLSIGSAFQLSPLETAELIQRTFFVTGLSSLLQIFWGHRLPIMEGPAGLWWGVFLIFAGLASATQQGTHEILQSMEMGLLISGGIFIMLSLFRLLHIIKGVFTPIVTGTYLILLVSQMSGTFVKGILGVNYLSAAVDWKVAMPAIIVAIVTIGLAYSKYIFFRSYSVLIGIGFGWMLFTFFGLVKPFSFQGHAWFSLPEFLAWGKPQFDMGILLTSIVTSLLLLSNLITSINVVGKVIPKSPQPMYNRSGFVMGLNQMLSGVFSTVGFVPVSYTAGFILSTKITEKLPFIIGSLLILAMSLFPAVTVVFAEIPVPVGYAVTFLSFSNLIGLSIKEYGSAPGAEEKWFVVGISLMVGMGCMFIPPEALANLPTFFMSILNNGLVMGVMTCIVLEQGIKMKRAMNTGKVISKTEL